MSVYTMKRCPVCNIEAMTDDICKRCGYDNDKKEINDQNSLISYLTSLKKVKIGSKK